MANIPKKIPERRCVGCGEHFPKPALSRIVRKPNGEIVLDRTGKVAGRGVYLCPSVGCLAKARKAKRCETALECPIPPEVYAQLEASLHESEGNG